MPYKYKINEQFFSKWNGEMAYVLGWIYSDGTLRKDRFQFKITSNDLQALVNIRKLLESNHLIKDAPRKDRKIITKELVIDSKLLYNQLVKVGLTPNKSKTMQLPIIPKKYFPQFLRGYLEGDGSVYLDTPAKRYLSYKRIRLRFHSGSNIFLEKLQEKISILWKIRNKALVKDHSGFLIAYSTYEVLKILKDVYKDTTSFTRLDRKYLIYKNFIKNYSFRFL